VTLAYTNAQTYLERRFAEHASMIKTFDEIKTLFHLPERPTRIEIYDNSHIQGSDAYGVMVVATQEGFDKKSYRKFQIKEKNTDFGGDDFAMMREVMRRRFSHTEDWEWPSLLLIDGGEGQLSSVLDTLKDLNISIPVVGISKGPDRNAGREKFHMPGLDVFSLPLNSPTLYFLQRIRDEAHRFAIGSHRAKREKKIRQSVLDEIPGIGAARKKLLLQHFGSAQDVKRAGLDDLKAVKGVSHQIAEKIYYWFHNTK
jgi:excinuclease ABC subunit C